MDYDLSALISDDQQSALDEALLDAKEEGFWLGARKASADIRAMKETEIRWK